MVSKTTATQPLHKSNSDSSNSLETVKSTPYLSKSLNTPKSNKPPTQRQTSAPEGLVQQSAAPKSDVVSSTTKQIETSVVTTHSKTSNKAANTMTSPSSALRTRNSSKSNLNTAASSGWKKSNGEPQNTTTTQKKSATTSVIVSSHTKLIVTTQSTQAKIINAANTPQKVITTVNTSIYSSASRTLQQPIGSNRPFRLLTSPTNALSSTAVSNSVAATLHSTLNSLLSQVATQRSPMIWNEHAGSKEQIASGDLIVTTVATSPSNTLNGAPIERFLPASLSQNSSQESCKGQSRTPSLSPTSNHSSSPPPPQPPAAEEKPHLNPIGSERGHKKPTVNQPSGLRGLPPLLQGI